MPFADKVMAHNESDYYEEQGWLYNVILLLHPESG
jgi:hypothetical protein